jgi:release factor glutamine methyltransferase
MPVETVASLLSWSRMRLTESGVDTPALDSRLLLQQATLLSHEALIAEPDRPVGETEEARFRQLVDRRCRREPVSRILGYREFYGRDFRLGPATLDPRPDTETLITAALALLADQPAPAILDLGTGTGAIAITLLAELPGAHATATDISDEALAIAASNAKSHGVHTRLTLVNASWYSGLSCCFDLIISNPPYLDTGRISALEPEVAEFDPLLALDGGMDGLSAYRAIAQGAKAHLQASGHVVVEIGEGQGEAVTALFAGQGLYLQEWHRDLGGHVRALVFGRSKKWGLETPLTSATYRLGERTAICD